MAFLSLEDPPELTRAPSFDADVEVVDAHQVWSPDGTSLAYVASLANYDIEVRVMDVETGEERVVHRDDGQDGVLASLDWSPDGGTLLTLETGIRDDSGEGFSNAIEIDLEEETTAVVLETFDGQLGYSAQDGSSKVSLFAREFGSPVIAETWTRGDDGAFKLSSSAEIGSDVGLVGGDRLVIPDCAIA